MRKDRQRISDAIDTVAAAVSQSTVEYRQLHQLRDTLDEWQADASDYASPQLGVLRDVIHSAIQLRNVR